MASELGRELDKEIASKVLGLTVWAEKDNWFCSNPKNPKNVAKLQNYSTEVDHAYQLVNYFQRKNLILHVGSTVIDDKIVWRACFYLQGEEKQKQLSWGNSLPHCICLAALAVISGANIIHIVKK